MTKEQLANMLNGREYGDEITDAEEKLAKSDGLVVIFGASDDLCELRGAVNDELGARPDTLIMIDKNGQLLPEIEDDDAEVLRKYGVLAAVQRAHYQATKIVAHWHDEGNPCWTYETTAPHASFDVIEDGKKYGIGVVIDLKELA